MARDLPDFTGLTADQAIAAVRRQGPAQRQRTVRALLYKKGNRPPDRAIQLRLLESFADDAELGPFERTYALVAAAHKASELGDAGTLAGFVPRLETSFDWARDLPMRQELRKDGLHLRFSILNVLIHAALWLDLDARDTYAGQILQAVAGINPRKTTHYTFNSTTNILNTVGIALLVRPGAMTATLPILRGLLYHSLRMKFARDLPAVMLRLGIPEDIAAVEPPSNFLKFEESFRKYLAIKRAEAAGTDAERVAHCWVIAEECVGQYTPEQKARHIDGIRRNLAPAWSADPARHAQG
ncbi:hypothetical protein [Roseivivax isoporae]|uniref:Uncharacterized protein n=1 Tax=Roseivivax isoporae LMG 25204 TaxID=1449351 RepID=X7F456_9RHOB|nr:hypothetical protein [Roseivivax isoporae]ETX27560.1 hypothetical protein RISW2_13465 [Roseivivax isoporae LMG 25204]